MSSNPPPTTTDPPIDPIPPLTTNWKGAVLEQVKNNREGWRRDMTYHLKANGAHTYVDGSESTPSQLSGNNRRWSKNNTMICGFIQSTIAKGEASEFDSFNSARDLWLALHRKYDHHKPFSKIHLVQKLLNDPYTDSKGRMETRIRNTYAAIKTLFTYGLPTEEEFNLYFAMDNLNNTDRGARSLYNEAKIVFQSYHNATSVDLLCLARPLGFPSPDYGHISGVNEFYTQSMLLASIGLSVLIQNINCVINLKSYHLLSNSNHAT